MTYKFPGTPAETKVAEFLVASTGGHFVTIVRPGVGELVGVSIRGETVVIRDLMAALSTDAEPFGWTSKHVNEGEEHRKWGRRRENVASYEGYIVQALYAEPVKTAEPVAWRYKDFADGWILDHSERSAREYQRNTGCVMQALYTSPPTLAVAIENLSDEQVRHIADAKDVASCRSRILSALSAQVQKDAPSWKNPDIFHDAEGRN